ncbi:unnamed protein product, partial [Musa banksii]
MDGEPQPYQQRETTRQTRRAHRRPSKLSCCSVKAATAEKGVAERELSSSVLSASVLGVSTCVSVPLGRRLCVAGAGDEGQGDLLEDLGLDLAPLRVGVPRGLLGLPDTCSTVHIKERLLAMRRGAD